ncbi:hypothetical protein MASR1M32_34900 [Rhodobacter sp.]
MIFRKSLLAAAAVVALALPAAAQQSEVLFQHKHWRVELVAWDDGVLGCQATVGTDTESFSIWTFQDSTVQLQFYSKAWDFGEGDSADLQLQIDRKPQWNLTDAELYRNSVLFTLPDSDSGVEFIVEVAKGNRLYLRSADGGGAGLFPFGQPGLDRCADRMRQCHHAAAEVQEPLQLTPITGRCRSRSSPARR